MSGKLDRRRARENRIRRGILDLGLRGEPPSVIAQKLGVSKKRVVRVLDTLLPAIQQQAQQQERISQVNINQVKTAQDLKVFLEQQQRVLDELEAELNEKRTESATRRIELTEQRVAQLASQGMSYPDAFEQALAELEEQELEAKAKVDKERRERVGLELDELTPEQERLLLEQDEED